MQQLLDQHTVSELREIMGDDISLLFDTFVQDTEEKLEQLQSQIVQQDTDQVRRTAHSIKGSSRNVGAVGLAEQCEAMESDARQGDLSKAGQQLHRIQEHFQQTKVAIQSLS